MKLTIEEIELQLIAIVQELLTESGEEYSQRTISPDASLQRHLGIDSLGRAELFARIEKKFNVTLPDQLMGEAETLEDIAQAILATTPKEEKLDLQKIHEHKIKKSAIDPMKAKTLIDVLLTYAHDNPERPHIYLQDEHGKEEIITYGKLLESSQRIAHALIKRGLRHGETVAIMQPTNPGFFYTFFGILLAGCVPVPIYPPFRAHQIAAYAKQEAKILRNAEARILVTFHEAENISNLLRVFIPSLKEVTTVNELLKTKEKAHPFSAKSNDYALIQYTSGSTSAPKGVLLTHHNLLSNIRAYGQAIQITPQDVGVSWVPLYHDLGLIGMWFGTLYYGIPLILLSPLTFLNRPERWLWAIHYHRGTISAGPNFSYELCVRKIDPAVIEGLDLSSWRIAASGAEAVQPKTLERFTKKFSAYGFKPNTFLPVYGLAEATVGLAFPQPPGRPTRIDVIERKTFEEESRAIPLSEDIKSEHAKNALEFVSCGIPLPGHAIRVVDENNQVLPERHVGLLQFQGPSSMQGYYGNPEATQAIYHDGWWDTGDLAYLADGEVFITGRRKDTIIKAGRNLYPTEIEELTATVSGIRQGCVIAFGISDAQRGTEKLIIVAETRETKAKPREQIIEHVTEKIMTALDIAPDHVLLVPPHTIPKTSSGKLQRSACKTAYLDEKLLKSHMPAWAQIIKLGLQWVKAKTQRTLSYAIRIFYTAYVAILLVATLLPTLLCVWIFPRRIAAAITKFWSRNIFRLAFCPVKIDGKKHLAQKNSPLIFSANHASYVDGILMIGILPAETKFVGKKELEKIPFLRRLMRKLGHLSVDRFVLSKGIEDTKQIENTLHDGSPILIFPEGTFSYSAGLRPFKLGAFKIAANTKTAICPVGIQGTRHILRGEEFLLSPGKIHVTISEPIFAQTNDWHGITQLRIKVRTEIAKYCGEPTLDLITAAPSASKKRME